MSLNTNPAEEPISRSDEKLLTWHLAWTALGILTVLLLGLLVVGFWFREPLMRVSHGFVEVFGGLGVALCYFLPDAFALPFPNDIGPLLGIAGGMDFIEASAWGAGGSVIGGFVGYIIGRGLRATRLVKWVLQYQDGRSQRLLDRYGLTAVAVAAITPLPYSIFCWAAGAGRLNFPRFMALTIPLRIIRVAGFLYLIQLGLLPGSEIPDDTVGAPQANIGNQTGVHTAFESAGHALLGSWPGNPG